MENREVVRMNEQRPRRKGSLTTCFFPAELIEEIALNALLSFSGDPTSD
jgi:hypothetical protein